MEMKVRETSHEIVNALGSLGGLYGDFVSDLDTETNTL